MWQYDTVLLLCIQRYDPGLHSRDCLVVILSHHNLYHRGIATLWKLLCGKMAEPFVKPFSTRRIFPRDVIGLREISR